MYSHSYKQVFPGKGYPMNPVGSPVQSQYLDGRDERFGGFFVPFLLGGLAGSAVVGVSRPRPVYVNPGPYPGYYPGPYYGPRPY